MIIDAFTYYNETDVLRLRLNVLYPHVDRFVILDSNETFTGNPKPDYFAALPEWIDPFLDKIERVTVSFPKPYMTTWERETYQRNQLANHIPDGDSDDLIILSDVDEIPNPDRLKDKYISPMKLDVTQYFWKLNWRVPDHCNQGGRPVILRRKDLHLTPQELRESELWRSENGGWHFSFLNADQLGAQKIESFSHTEYDLPEFKTQAHFATQIEQGIDPFNRFPLRRVEIDETYPKWIVDNIDSLAYLVQPPIGE